MISDGSYANLSQALDRYSNRTTLIMLVKAKNLPKSTDLHISTTYLHVVRVLDYLIQIRGHIHELFLN